MRDGKIKSGLKAQFTKNYRIQTATDGKEKSIIWLKKTFFSDKFLKSLKKAHHDSVSM
jgi:hypothetical protein